MTTPTNATTRQLEQVIKAYDVPANSLEAFALEGAKAELACREAERLNAPPEKRDGCSEEFDEVLEG